MDILSRYGIKEVADITFYNILPNGEPGEPVLYLDTLKVSTIEQTAESTSARGGKGNSELIMWDYGKEITLTLEDALFSAKSMAMMYGVDINSDNFGAEEYVLKTVNKSNVKNYDSSTETAIFIVNGQDFMAEKVKFYNEVGEIVAQDKCVFVTGNIKVSGQKIIISADKFPKTYYITGDTYARSETTGRDEFFQFIIPKAKMQSEVSLTMEAEGDPSTFNMSLKVLRPLNGEMMKLVKYELSPIIKQGVLETGIAWTLDSTKTLTLTGVGNTPSYASWSENSQDWSPFVTGDLNGSYTKIVLDIEGMVGADIFYGQAQVTQVIIGEAVSWISNGAFQGTSISSVFVPSNCQLEGGCFTECVDLKSIYIDDSYNEMNSMHMEAPWGAPNATVYWKGGVVVND